VFIKLFIQAKNIYFNLYIQVNDLYLYKFFYMTEKVGYLRVQNELKRQIITGFYKRGDMLPSENKLVLHYNLSRMTIRNALKNLESDGLIYRKKGKGSFVRYKRKSIELLSVKGFTEIMKGKHIEFDTVFIQKPEIKKLDKSFFWDMDDKELDTGFIHFSRIRRMQNEPIMFENTFMSKINLPKFCSNPFVNNSLFDTLYINHQIEITAVIQKFRAISATKEMAQRLKVEKGSPVLEIIRKLSTSKPDFYIYSFAYCNTDNFTIET